MNSHLHVGLPLYLKMAPCARAFGISVRELERYVSSRWVRAKKGMRSKQGSFSVRTDDVLAVQDALGRGAVPKQFRRSIVLLDWDALLKAYHVEFEE
jgi:hypothetical protein